MDRPTIEVILEVQVMVEVAQTDSVIPTQDNVIFTDRSRVTAVEKCYRYRYYHYEYDGVGLESAGQWLDPLIGTAVHECIEQLVTGVEMEAALALGREYMLAAQREGPILVYKPTVIDDQLRPELDFQEGMELMEALVRGWAVCHLDRSTGVRRTLHRKGDDVSTTSVVVGPSDNCPDLTSSCAASLTAQSSSLT